MMTLMRMIGYIRVSTFEQGLSIEAQKARLELEAQLRGWSLRICVDEGKSGALPPAQRPALSAALEALRTGEAQGIAVAKLDRMARSLSDMSLLLERSKTEGWGLVALDLGIDTSTPEGQMIVGIMASIAQWERARLRERIIEALAIKKASGDKLGAPVRYDENVVKRVCELRSAGETWQAISSTLHSEGVQTKRALPLSIAQVRALHARA